MLKVLIADDEPRVGQLVKHLIHWTNWDLALWISAGTGVPH